MNGGDLFRCSALAVGEVRRWCSATPILAPDAFIEDYALFKVQPQKAS